MQTFEQEDFTQVFNSCMLESLKQKPVSPPLPISFETDDEPRDDFLPGILALGGSTPSRSTVLTGSLPIW